MIRGQFAVIRTAEPDDVAEFERLADADMPRSFMLDARRELQTPTADDLREALSRKEVKNGLFYAIEDREGAVRGFCALKSPAPDVFYSEIVLAFQDVTDYAQPIANEVMDFLKRLAFVERKLNKIVAQRLDNEVSYRELLIREGFEPNGVQRQVVYTGGRYHDIETLSLFRDSRAAGSAAPASAGGA